MKLTSDCVVETSERQQISEEVDLITKQITEYKKESDLDYLEKLKDLCLKENMTLDMAKMHRNIGMYHFYTNDFCRSQMSMQQAIDTLKTENCTNLLAEYYSELGLVYFYNREYLLARRYYEETEELLWQVPYIDNKMLYLHNCRYGILLSNMQEYQASMLKLQKALLYSADEKEAGLIIMNIGLLHKRQRDLKAAIKYYSKALCLLDGRDMKTKGIVYNNLAEVYKILGQYDKSLYYIKKAFKCISDNDLSRMFVYFNTFTEIKILTGERESVLDEFISLLSRVKDFHLYKSLIIEGISNMIIIGSEDRNILNSLETAVIKLVEDNGHDDGEYLKELKVHLGNIRLCLKELKN